MSLKKGLQQIQEQVEEESQEGMNISYQAEKPYLIRVKEELYKNYDFRYNEILDSVEFKKTSAKKWQLFRFEENLNTIWIEFQLNESFPKKPTISLLNIILKSDFTVNYNAIHEYFEQTKWDGKDHLTNLAATVIPAEIHLDENNVLPNLWAPLFRRWMISAVACMNGISPNQVMLLFIGTQGTFKTTWLNMLCPDPLKQYSFTGHINPDLTDNRTADLLSEKAFLNIDDQLDSIMDKDFSKIKSVISIDYINNRKAFRKDAKRRNRIANIVGSVNKEKLFLDVENRRYLTFKIEKILIDKAKKIDINQVWAQAYHLFKNKERYWFDSSEIEKINLINNHFAINTAEEEWLLKCYAKGEDLKPNTKYVMFNEILSVLKNASGLNLRPNFLTNAMKKLDYEKASKRITVNGERQPRQVYPVQELFFYDTYGKIKLYEGQLPKEEKPNS